MSGMRLALDLPTPLGPPLERPPADLPARERLIGTEPGRRRSAPSRLALRRRRRMLRLTKWSLPLLALVLLSSVALWPELTRVRDQGRVTMHRLFQVEPESGRMRDPRYRGVDQRGRPYTVTATTATQTSAERIALTDPQGDVVTESGTWLLTESKQGVYLQHLGLMDLSVDVQLYREDGTLLQTDAAALDLKAGAATSADKTHAEGPFGVLDAQGFTLTDKGASIQFPGPAHLVMNGASKP